MEDSKQSTESVASRDKEVIFTRRDVYFVLVFFVLGLITRCYDLEFPSQVVFDEYHFGKFTNYYLNGEFYIDVHPPFSKVLLYLWARFIGYDGKHSFETIGLQYTHDFYYYMRLPSAILGSIHVVVIYLSCRVLKLSLLSSVFATSLFLMDNSIITQARGIYTDAFLLLWIQLGLFFSLLSARYRMFSSGYYASLAGSGLFLAFGVSTKLTATGFIGTVLVHQALLLFRYMSTQKNYERSVGKAKKNDAAPEEYTPRETKISQLILWSAGIVAFISVPILIVFIIFVCIHFHITPYRGAESVAMGDEYYQLLLPPGTPLSEVKPFTVSQFLHHFQTYLYYMYLYNFPLDLKHQASSVWYHWPTGLGKPILYWQSVGEESGQWIVNTFNPTVNWLILGSLFIFLAIPFTFGWWESIRSGTPQSSKKVDYSPSDPFVMFFEELFKNYQQYFSVDSLTLFIGWVGSLFPFITVTRATFLYHYYPGICIGVLLVGVIVEVLKKSIHKLPIVLQLFANALFIAVFIYVTWMFLYLGAWTYGWTISKYAHDCRFMFELWKYT